MREPRPETTPGILEEESEALLHYQRHTFDEIAEAVAAGMGWRRRVASAASPLARAAMLRLSPYYRYSR